MPDRPTRRELMKTTAALAVSAAAPAAESALPKGEIGKLKISRLMLGGNLLARYTHSRDLKYVYRLAEHYNTDEKLLETLALAEAHGIDTLAVHPDPRTMPVLKRHRARGGKIKWILCTEPPEAAPVEGNLDAHRRRVADLVEQGADALYFWGVRADQLVKAGKMDLLAKAVEVMRATKLPVGMGGHALATVVECEKAGIDCDFYLKTLHHHDYPTAPRPGQAADDFREFPGYWCGKPQETVEFMSTVKKPWIAFKVMAAGAIPPQNAFRYAFEKGADFVLAGMFDFEIADDVQLAKGILADLPNRPRPWRA
ncbi:MAG: hypothetical protein IT161_17040 [Bryobacterales bacterium]|nr:hypothetical protein [Bryobacterales bacterium]